MFFILKALQVFRTLKNSDQTINDHFQVNDEKRDLSSNSSDTFKRNIEKQDRSEYYSDYENDTKK
jgi:hypothetical protein